MTAKEYLLQIKEQKQNIRKQEEYIQRLRDSLTIAGISYDKERIQSSPDPDKFAKIFGQIDEEEQRLEDMKTRFVNTRVKIINQIHQLAEEKHQNVSYLMLLFYQDCILMLWLVTANIFNTYLLSTEIICKYLIISVDISLQIDIQHNSHCRK